MYIIAYDPSPPPLPNRVRGFIGVIVGTYCVLILLGDGYPELLNVCNVCWLECHNDVAFVFEKCQYLSQNSTQSNLVILFYHCFDLKIFVLWRLFSLSSTSLRSQFLFNLLFIKYTVWNTTNARDILMFLAFWISAF